MTMFVYKLAIVAVVCVSAWCQLVRDVCSSPQWEAVQATLYGEYRDGVPSVVQTNNKISYDLNNTRLAATISNGHGNPIKKIYDYKKKTLYTIVGQSCNKTLLDTPFKKACVPHDAHYSWDMTHYGIDHDNMILIWEYLGSTQDGVNYIIHTLYDGNPVMEQTYGNVHGVSFFSHSAFLNMTSGIKNPDVFIPPSGCKGADPQLSQTPISERLGFMAL